MMMPSVPKQLHDVIGDAEFVRDIKRQNDLFSDLLQALGKADFCALADAVSRLPEEARKDIAQAAREKILAWHSGLCSEALEECTRRGLDRGCAHYSTIVVPA
jgi:hypothetical protein